MLAALATQVQQLAMELTHAPVMAPPTAPPCLHHLCHVLEPHLNPWWGEPEGCNMFLINRSVLFAMQPYTFATEEAKVAFTINHLMRRARLWGTAEGE